jgi:hypothetical protein
VVAVVGVQHEVGVDGAREVPGLADRGDAGGLAGGDADVEVINAVGLGDAVARPFGE